ncbi:MAG: dihydroorotate dehydrogenase electron transfer subunit [Nannocystaceae bacterium]
MSAAQLSARVIDNRPLTGGYFVLTFEAERPSAIAETIPGQFAMVRGAWGRDLLNPRAFSVLHAADARRFSILAKVFGRGTARLQVVEPGAPVTVTAPLGRGFRPPARGKTQLLVAGGVGLPPLHLQARVAAQAGIAGAVELLYGGRTRADLVLLEDLAAWDVRVTLTTEDGSAGERGFVTAPLERRLDEARARGEDVEVLACGPTPMLRAVQKIGLSRQVPTYLCLEEVMACGFGVCLGCAVPVYGPKPYRYCCTDGPVFDAREVRWS